ncbi:MAG: hypothetical protein BMS9Abin20_0377 [Acidimicrobiia bacterium]|nr:MAG: hypothetical protein BMS9Abin20_0377 [Acidimicrobiia bacterium]
MPDNPDALPEPELTESAHATPPRHKKRPWWQQILSIAVTLLVLVVVFGFVIPQLADYRSVLDYIGAIDTGEWLVLVALSIWFLVAYAIVLMQVLRTLSLREAFVNQTTGTAITNAVPSGGAIALPLNYTMYMSWGFTPAIISAALLSAGVWDWLARISLPVLAVFAIAAIGDALGWMWLVSIGGLLFVAGAVYLLVKLLGNETAARKVAEHIDAISARVFRVIKREKPNVAGMVMQFRIDLNRIVRHHFGRLTAATVGNHVALTGLFTACVYAVGITQDMIPIPWVVLAFTLGRFLVMIPVSPGGLGLVDLGWIGILTLGWQTTNPGIPVDASLISAGVLLFRALSFLPPIPTGMATWLFWRSNKSWRNDWQTMRRGETSV